MAFSIISKLLDALILASLDGKDSYGYKITRDIGTALEVSESTLYPVLRRLQKEECLESYDMEHMGRNRRYYRLTGKGSEYLVEYRESWINYKEKIESVLLIKE